MGMIRSKSSRFVRSFNYTMPEYRPSAPKGAKTEISLMAPTAQVRTVGHRKMKAGESR